MIEYKVLGMGSVEVDGNPIIFHSLMIADPMPVNHVQACLSVLGIEGWDAVTLSYPYVFKRIAPAFLAK